jgi:hypothetical protein
MGRVKKKSSKQLSRMSTKAILEHAAKIAKQQKSDSARKSALTAYIKK